MLESKINTPEEANLRIFDDLELKILNNFEPAEKFVMSPGDVLYIPPGTAHCANSLGNSLSFSIGIKEA